jgi:uncharacterized membrane protein YqhA
MAKLKKIGVLTFGLILTLALVINQLVQMLAGYVLNLQSVSDYIQYLKISENSLMLGILSWSLIILIAFIVGVVLVGIYNLISKWIGIEIEISGPKKK